MVKICVEKKLIQKKEKRVNLTEFYIENLTELEINGNVLFRI